MIALLALSIASSPTPTGAVAKPAVATFTATATILRAAEVGHGRSDPPGGGKPRTTTISDAAGAPHPAIIYDFQ